MDLAKTKRLLAIQEGNVLHPYDDETGMRVKAPKGHITIGHGHNLDGHTFDYDKETGVVTYPSKSEEIP